MWHKYRINDDSNGLLENVLFTIGRKVNGKLGSMDVKDLDTILGWISYLDSMLVRMIRKWCEMWILEWMNVKTLRAQKEK